MISIAPKLTEAGKSLQIRALGGEKITFTRFKIGNGEISGTDVSNLTDLVNPLVSFAIKSIDNKTTGYVKLTGSFDSTDITNDFRWRELGIFCEGEKTALFNGNGSTKTFTLTDKPIAVNSVKVGGTAVTVSSYNSSTGVVTLTAAPVAGSQNVAINYTDGDEKLYAYTNDGNNAGMLKANSTDVVSEQTVALIIAVGETANVTAIISESVLYAKKTDFENHTAAKNPHGTTKSDIGLGNVPNVSTNDQTVTYSVPAANGELVSGEKMSTAFGKIAKAVKSLIAHISDKNNPHGIEASDIGAADEEHSHSAADISSGTLSVLRGGTGKSSWIKNGIPFAKGTNELSQISVPAVASYLVQKNDSFTWIPADKVGRKTTRYVVGTSTNGWTAETCDYLCTGTDDQAIINKALAALPSTGGTVILLDGTYSISNNISITKPYTTLQGTGASYISFTAGYTITIGANNCTVRDINITGGGSSNTSGIAATDRNRTKIENVRMKTSRIHFKNCKNSLIVNNFVGESNSYNHGICLEDGSGNTVSGNNTSGAYFGICATNETHLCITGNTSLENNEYGIYCTSCKSVVITGNVVYSKVGGYDMGYAFSNCDRITFTNNSGFLEDKALGSVVTFEKCNKCNIIGNIIKNLVSGNKGMYLSSCTYFNVTANVFIASSTSYAYSTSSCSNINAYYNQTSAETE